MNAVRLFTPALCQVANSLQRNRLRMIETAVNASLHEVQLVDVERGDACVQLDSEHSRLKLFNKSLPGAGARCDYALMMERDQDVMIWLFDLKSSKRDANSATIGLENGERLLKFCFSLGHALDSDINIPKTYVRAVIYPRASQIRSTRANRRSMDVKYDDNGTCRIEVDAISGKARVSVRRLCG